MKRLLVVHTWGIGDWIFFTPALRALRAAHPGVQVDVLVGTPGTAPIVGYYDGVKILGVTDVRKDGWSILKLLLLTLRRHYDAALFTAGIDSVKADWLALFIRSRAIVALTTHIGHHPRFIHRHKEYDENQHRVANNLALIELLDVRAASGLEPYLPLHNVPVAHTDTLLIHPGCDSASAYKRWPVARFVAVAREMLEQCNSVSVVLGPAEHDLERYFTNLLTHPRFALYTDTTFDSALRLIATHEVTLHSDSGLGHIAAVLGRKSVAIFGPANLVATKPVGTRVSVVRLDTLLPCQPCMRPGGRYGCDEHPCLEEITTGAVIDKVRAAFGTTADMSKMGRASTSWGAAKMFSPTEMSTLNELVSVIMPAHNSEKYIGEAIESVKKQTHENWELVITDDASTDGTSRIVAKFAAKDPRIRVLRLDSSLGPARARNHAIDHAKGRYIAFLDSDDIWLPAKLERQLQVMRDAGVVLSFSAYKKIDSHGNVGHAVIQVPPTVTYSELLRTNVIGCLTAVYDTQALGKMYMPEDTRRDDYRLWLQILKLRRHHEDYALWLAILRRVFRDRESVARKTVIGIDEVLAYYRVHSRSVSSNKIRAAAMQWAVYRQGEKLSLCKSIYYFAHYAYHGYKKARLR